MNKNTVKVGDYTLTVSMATLAMADKELLGRGKKPVLEAFGSLIPAMTGNLNDVDLAGVDFEAFSVVMWSFMQPKHNLSYEDTLKGPLNEGLPQDWLIPLGKLIMDNVATAKADDKAKSGNAKAA